MDSVSPGHGPEARPAAQQQAGGSELLREEWLWLQTQSELRDWTRPQPEERLREGATAVRVQRVKTIMEKACEVFEAKASRMAHLRNARDNITPAKRMEACQEIELLKNTCGAYWGLLGGLIERGSAGAREFVLGLQSRLEAARAAGSQQARRSQEGKVQSLEAAGVLQQSVEKVEERIRAGSSGSEQSPQPSVQSSQLNLVQDSQAPVQHELQAPMQRSQVPVEQSQPSGGVPSC